MLTASVENMLVTSIDTTLETGVVPTVHSDSDSQKLVSSVGSTLFQLLISAWESMAHDLAHQHFRSYEEVKQWIDLWIASKEASFFRDGIRQFSERWKKVVADNGQYFES